MKTPNGSHRRTKKIRLLLIEDNRLLREGITALVKKQRDLQLVAASGMFENTIVPLRGAKPEVVLLDQCLQNQSTLYVLKAVKKNLPEAKVIVMGLIPVREDVVDFVKAGATGFFLKDSSSSDFLKTIRSVARGAKVFPPQLIDSLFSHIVEEAEGNGKVKVTDVRLTKRQREIIDLVGEGLTNKEIAQKLCLATYTVKSHVHAILEKLALRNRLQMAIYATPTQSAKTAANRTLLEINHSI